MYEHHCYWSSSWPSLSICSQGISAVDWNFPSPTATPTSASYNHNTFQTPKTSTFPSHFQDAFATPQMPSYTPQPSETATMTPLQRPHTSAGPLQNQYYVHGPAVAGQPMLAPHQSNYTMSPMYGTSQPQAMQTAPNTVYDTSQMQTPPPTRGTSVKKPQMQNVAFGTPSTIASRRFMTPQQGQAQPQLAHSTVQTPMQYQLQFTPEMYQFGNFGPATAPAMPQSQLLWDPNSPTVYQHHTQYQTQQPRLEDPFVPASNAGLQWPAQVSQQSITPLLDFGTPAMNGFHVQAPPQRPASTVNLANTVTPAMTTASVDPSLLYSSPVRPVQESPPVRANVQPPNPRASAKKPAANRKDSSHSQQQSQDHERADNKATRGSVPTASSSSRSIVRPSLQRSNTTGHLRPQSAQSFTSRDSLSRSNSLLQVSRTASPLKRVGKSNLGSISEGRKSRPSVILTVDESGRAKAIRTDDSPTKSVRDRYPGLFDSETSDDEQDEDDDEDSMSNSASFSFARGQERSTKIARLDPPIENLDGLDIPRSSSRSSISSLVPPSRAAIAAAVQLRRGNSLRKKTPSRSGQRRVSSAASIDTAPMDISQQRRQSIIGSEDFNRGLTLSTGESLDAHNLRWSQMSFDQQSNVSPTRLSQSTGTGQPRIRCLCGVNSDRGQQLIQCKSCTQWLHGTCIGVSAGAVPPPAFTCFLCTRPAARAPVSNRKKL